MTKKQKDKKQKEQKSKIEIIFFYSSLALALVAIVLVLIFVLPKDGKTSALTKEYEYLPYENIYEVVSIDDVKGKINNKESFHLFLCNGSLDEAKYYAYYVNEIASAKGIKVFYLKTDDLSISEKNYLKQELGLGKEILDAANIVFFNEGLVDYQTYTGEVDEFANSWEQILNYFNQQVDDE